MVRNSKHASACSGRGLGGVGAARVTYVGVDRTDGPEIKRNRLSGIHKLCPEKRVGRDAASHATGGIASNQTTLGVLALTSISYVNERREPIPGCCLWIGDNGSIVPPGRLAEPDRILAPGMITAQDEMSPTTSKIGADGEGYLGLTVFNGRTVAELDIGSQPGKTFVQNNIDHAGHRVGAICRRCTARNHIYALHQRRRDGAEINAAAKDVG